MDGIARPTSRGEGGGGGGGAAGGRDGVVGGGVVIGGGRGVVANHNCGGANEGGVDGSEKVVAAGEGVAARVAGGGLAGLPGRAGGPSVLGPEPCPARLSAAGVLGDSR